MKFKLYSVLDLVVKSYSPPFTAQSDAVAIRAVLGVLRDTNSALYLHPHDYRLFAIGEWDDETGSVTSTIAQLIVDVAGLLPSKDTQ